MDKIDLGDIMKGEIWDNHDTDLIKGYIRKGINQALILVEKRAKIKRGPHSVAGDGVFSINNLCISGILDIEKLIV